ncbi:GAF and ANTAR domain-containing protein [Streptomyces sediminimaris]|uniref:GAF and ANTAR domain-containing protein n=1 Tax=Streptomyces sediminimaris TaxID=3383721 RepID=UPI00399C463D
MAREQRLAEIFVELADSLVDDFDIIDFLQRLSSLCVELLDVRAAGIMLADGQDGLQVVAASAERTRLLELFALQHDQGPCAECLRSREPRINIDLTDAETTAGWPDFAARARDAGYTVTHALPLRLRQRIVGALNLFQPGPHVLGQGDIALAQAMADVATVAILQQRSPEQPHVEHSRVQTVLTSRVLIEQVKGVLAERWGTTVDQAFDALRAQARQDGVGVAELARQIIDGSRSTAAIPPPAAPARDGGPS